MTQQQQNRTSSYSRTLGKLVRMLIKLEYNSHCNNLLFDGFAGTRNETVDNCYALIRQDLFNLYSDDYNVNEGNGLTKLENFSALFRYISMAVIFQQGIILSKSNYSGTRISSSYCKIVNSFPLEF